MSRKIDFINFIVDCVGDREIPKELESYWEAFKTIEVVEKQPFTDTGKMILNFLRENSSVSTLYKSRDIAEQTGIMPRRVSGSMRKLVTDGYVEKVGQDPAIYTLTELGKTVEII